MIYFLVFLVNTDAAVGTSFAAIFSCVVNIVVNLFVAVALNSILDFKSTFLGFFTATADSVVVSSLVSLLVESNFVVGNIFSLIFLLVGRKAFNSSFAVFDNLRESETGLSITDVSFASVTTDGSLRDIWLIVFGLLKIVPPYPNGIGEIVADHFVLPGVISVVKYREFIDKATLY